MTPKKLIRLNVTHNLKEGEWEVIRDQKELNRLYALKIREELAEIQASDHEDIMEFADLLQVVFDFAGINGISSTSLEYARHKKVCDKGGFNKTVLNNLNPENPSNKIYFDL